MRNGLKKMGRTATPYRAGVTTDGLVHNKYRSKCYGRGACSRHVGGCDIHAAFDSPTGLIYPARDTGQLTIRTNATAHEVQVDPATGKAKGVGFVDTVTGKSYSVHGPNGHPRGLDARVRAPDAAVEVVVSIPTASATRRAAWSAIISAST